MKPLRLTGVMLSLIICMIGCGKSYQPPKAAEQPQQNVTSVDEQTTASEQVEDAKNTTQEQPHIVQEKPDDQEQTKEQPTGADKLPKITYLTAFGGATFDTPVGLKHAGDGSGHLYVIEQPGRIIQLSDASDKPTQSVFLDLTKIVHNEGWEQGLLGLAFHPDYKENGKFYVNYTTSKTTVIAEYKRSTSDASKADPKSAKILLEFDQPYDNHNGGELVFGPDGYLYIAVGDGGSGGDPEGNGQNRQTFLGNILRIDVDQSSGLLAYGIPADNPFVANKEGYREEIYAYGLRNPWRMSFDAQTGALWAGDVGQNRIEEVNIINKGENYGWNVMEGTSCYIPENCSKDEMTLPIWEYSATERGASITGGYVYRGSEIPGLNGAYIFSDFMDGRVWALSYQGDSAAKVEQLDLYLPNITSFGVDEQSEIYACLYDGTILLFVEDR
jgi:glucose/arabinose dehydrogenase